MLLCNAISIHAPRVGSDGSPCPSVRPGGKFQSTLPVWGATGQQYKVSGLRPHFNPRSPCGERLCLKLDFVPLWLISIHAPRVGSDSGRFISTGVRWDISIHAPRVGSDFQLLLCNKRFADFNPRSPCGERLLGEQPRREALINFNPRSPCGERPRRFYRIG